MQALEQLLLAERHVSGQSNEEIMSMTLAIIELHLSESIS